MTINKRLTIFCCKHYVGYCRFVPVYGQQSEKNRNVTSIAVVNLIHC
ncbi:MAG: hypothetical protein LBU34_13270 [Planctomycetaceae bacterium]|nr:hypothetical protein [Planctomycetaceae bacterium]